MTPMDSQTTLTISEGYDLPTQQHYTKKKFSCCDCFHRQCTFRLWQILVFLLVIAFIIAVLGLLIAMLGPGNTNLKYSKTSKSESKAENPTNKIHTGNLLISLLRHMVKLVKAKSMGQLHSKTITDITYSFIEVPFFEDFVCWYKLSTVCPGGEKYQINFK